MRHDKAGGLLALARALAASAEGLTLEQMAREAGARPAEDPGLISALRLAIMAMKAVRFRYRGGSRQGAERDVTPYGIMFGRANYLVAALLAPDGTRGEPRNYRLDRIEDLEVL